jgi:hypothetical protein
MRKPSQTEYEWFYGELDRAVHEWNPEYNSTDDAPKRGTSLLYRCLQKGEAGVEVVTNCEYGCRSKSLAKNDYCNPPPFGVFSRISSWFHRKKRPGDTQRVATVVHILAAETRRAEEAASPSAGAEVVQRPRPVAAVTQRAEEVAFPSPGPEVVQRPRPADATQRAEEAASTSPGAVVRFRVKRPGPEKPE